MKGTQTMDAYGEIIAASGISLRMWRSYAYFWLVCVVFPVLTLLQAALPVGNARDLTHPNAQELTHP